MINFILKDILCYQLELPLFLFLILLVAAYYLGYQDLKRKYRQKDFPIQNPQSIATSEKEQQTQQIERQEQPQKEQVIQEKQYSIRRLASEKSQPTKQNNKLEGEYMTSDLLKQKLPLDSKKLHSTSYLQIRMQPSSNLRYMRKIEKHQLITEYEVKQQQKPDSDEVVPYKNTPSVALAEPNSCLSVTAKQDHTRTFMGPQYQQPFVQMNYFTDFSKRKQLTTWLTETGKFNKFYRKVKVIGKGGFGCVFRAENIYDQKEYAIKKIIIDGSAKLNQLLQQVSIISKYNHPNIVFYYTCWIELSSLDEINHLSSYIESKAHQKEQQVQSFNYVSQNSGFQFEHSSKNRSKSKSSIKDKNAQVALIKPTPANNLSTLNFYTLHIQMELCHGSLYEYLRTRNTLNFAEVFQIIVQLLLGIQFLHSNGIVHRDLKPGNILMNKLTNQIKIGDFGLSTLIQSHSEQRMRNKVGTPLYMAPELSTTNPIAKQNIHLVDIFSVGVIYYELLNEFSACTQHERYQKIHSLQQNSVNFPSKQLKDEKKFIKLLTKKSNMRPSIFEALRSPEFAILKTKYEA